MNKEHLPASNTDLSRRHFLKNTSLGIASAAAAVQMPFILTAHAAPDDPIKIGLIGCGGRGTGAALDALGAAANVIYPKAGYHTEDVQQNAEVTEKGVKIVALADVFPDRLERCRTQLGKLNMAIGDEYCFTGFDAYKKMLEVKEINYVICATPPHFRPIHLRAAIEAGKNVFMEKPVAVDGPGIRSVIESGELARPVHDRMPVLLEPSQYAAWLDFKYRDTAALEHFFAPFPSTRMKCFPVSPRVNSPRHDDPQCIIPLPSQDVFPGFKE